MKIQVRTIKAWPDFIVGKMNPNGGFIEYPDEYDKLKITTDNGSTYEIEEGKNGSLSMHSIGAICEQKEIAV